MQIILNGELYTASDRITVHDLISNLNCNNTNFAVAVNLSVVPRGRHTEYWLKENDKVEIVTAFQGG